MNKSIPQNLLAIIFSLLLFWGGNDQNPKEGNKVFQDFIANPSNFHLVGDDRILVDDPTAPYPLYVVDISSGEIIHKARKGNGPGELGWMYKNITFPADDIIAVYDRAQLRMHLFDQQLNFIETLNTHHFSESLMQAGYFDSEFLFTIPSREDFLNVYDLSQEEESPVWNLHIDDNESIRPLSNFLLRQDILVKGGEEELYLAFRYSSLLLKIDRDGIVFETLGPENYTFPEITPRDGGVYSLPPLDEYPVGALDIDVDENHVYVLYSGKKMDGGFLSRFRSPESAVEKITHSDRVLIYNRETGDFVREITLPLAVNKFKVAGSKVYLYRTIDESYPSLYTFERTEVVGF